LLTQEAILKNNLPINTSRLKCKSVAYQTFGEPTQIVVEVGDVLTPVDQLIGKAADKTEQTGAVEDHISTQRPPAHG